MYLGIQNIKPDVSQVVQYLTTDKQSNFDLFFNKSADSFYLHEIWLIVKIVKQKFWKTKVMFQLRTIIIFELSLHHSNFSNFQDPEINKSLFYVIHNYFFKHQYWPNDKVLIFVIIRIRFSNQ